ncbi:MAG: hypothetical protein IT260_20310 [Saprospiraceae bacterium]|nr:hypothetical protein [Saprospiraceae bacterium]
MLRAASSPTAIPSPVFQAARRACFRILGLWLVGLCLSLHVQAQTEDAVASFDSQFVETGNPFLLHLAVPRQYGQPLRIAYEPWESFLPSANILHRSTWKDEGDIWGQHITFIAFDSAHFQLPPLGIVLQNGDTLYTAPLELTVLPTPSPDDPVDMLDIKGIYQEPVEWQDYIGPVMPIAVGLLILSLVIAWVMRRQRTSGLRKVRALQLPPHELALRQLSELERQQHWQNGRIKVYYSELSHIAREYLEVRYQIPALKSASAEIIRLLARTDVPAPLLPPLSEFLSLADLAKFAKSIPPETYHAKALQELRYLVEQTKPRPAAENQSATPTENSRAHP